MAFGRASGGFTAASRSCNVRCHRDGRMGELNIVLIMRLQWRDARVHHVDPVEALDVLCLVLMVLG